MSSNFGYDIKGYRMVREGKGKIQVCLQNVIIKGLLGIIR